MFNTEVFAKGHAGGAGISQDALVNTGVGEYPQWFTGPLLSLTPVTMDIGHPAIEPSLSVTNNYGFYDQNGSLKKISNIISIQPFVDFQFALNKFMGLEILASSSTNFSKGSSSTHLDDTSLFLGFQALKDQPGSWIPDFRVLFQEIFPTGKYKNLDPKKHKTDLTGQGAFSTGVNFVTQKLFQLKNGHKFCIEASIGWLIPSSVKIEGISYYGGNPQTDTKVYPGSFFNGFLVGQYSLSRTWGLTLETIYTQGLKGKKAMSSQNQDVFVPKYYQLSLAPEIQHTLSNNLGLILGGWFTVLGENSDAFAQGFFAVLYIF